VALELVGHLLITSIVIIARTHAQHDFVTEVFVLLVSEDRMGIILTGCSEGGSRVLLFRSSEPS